MQRRGDPGDQPPATGRHHHGADVGHLLEDLEPDRRLSGEDVDVVERMHQRRTGALGVLPGEEERVVDRETFEVHARPVRLGRHDLRQRRRRRHEHSCRDAEFGRRPGHTLRVVTGAGGDDAAGALVRAQVGDPVVGAARLERAGALQVLALEPDLVAGAVRQHPRRGRRGPPHHRFQQIRRGADTVEGEQVHGSAERLLQIADQIGGVLDTDRETHQILGDFEFGPGGGGVRHRAGMLDQRFDPAQRLGECENLGT